MGNLARIIAPAFAAGIAGGLIAVAAWKFAEAPGRTQAAQPPAASDAAMNRLPGLDELERQAESNSRSLAEVQAGLRELKDLLARESSATPEPEDPRRVEEPGRAQTEDAARRKAPLPPSRHPFLDYETLPEAYLSTVGEDEIFYLFEDGRLARLSFPDSNVSPRRDLETRNRSQELLRLHVEQSLMAEEWMADSIARGNYKGFESVEAAQEYINERRSSKARLVLQSLPGGKGYAVLDRTSLEQNETIKAGRERTRQLTKELGFGSMRIFTVDPPAASGRAPPEVPHDHEKTAR